MSIWRIALAALLLFGLRHSLYADEKPAATATSTVAPVMKVQVEAASDDSKDRVLAFSKLIVALLPAFAWPVLVGLALWWFRFPVRNILEAIAHWIPNAKGFEFGPVKFIGAALEQVAEEVKADPKARDKVTPEERQMAKFVAAAASNAPDEWVAARVNMDKLAREYDALRAQMSAAGGPQRPSSPQEIVQMNKIVAQMRALGVACKTFWDEYAASDKAGDRLAAVVVAQMAPDPRYLEWLSERFRVDKPFIFYHAALAIQDIADQCWTEAHEKIVWAAKHGLEAVQSYKGGPPDQKTMDLLNSILQRQKP